MQETYFLIRAGREYSYVVVKLEFCNSGPGCGCGPACGRVETRKAQVLGRYTTHSSPYTTGSAVSARLTSTRTRHTRPYPPSKYRDIPRPCAILLVRGSKKNAIEAAFQSRDLATQCCPLRRIHSLINTLDEGPNFLSRYTG